MSPLRQTAGALIASGRLERGERSRMALSVLLSAGATGAAIALLATSGYLISRAAQRPQILALMVTIVAVRAFGLSRAALRYGERLASHDLALRQLARLRVRFYARLVPLLPGAFRRDGGDLLARFVADVDTLSDLYLRTLIPAIAALVVIAGASLAAWLILPASGGAVLGTLALSALALPWLSARVAQRSGRRQAAVRARLLGELVETIDGAAELVMCDRGEDRVRQLQDSDAELSRLVRADALAASLATFLGGALSAVGLLVVLVLGIDAVHSGALSGVLLAALAFLLLASYEGVAPLPAAARALRGCAAAARRLQEIGAQRHLVQDLADPLVPHGGGTLAADAVSLRYGPEEPWVFRDFALSLSPGEHVALVGPSGAGKSSLAELLVRFRDPDAGSVTLDGIDVREISQEQLRRAVLLCDQDAHLFNTTIRENLLIARPAASEQELLQALRVVELSGLLADLPDGLDTVIAADGATLSGGQRQRVALARALLSDARFLILDEATSHLDAQLAHRVLRGVFSQRPGRGVLLITHDLQLAEACERTLRLAPSSPLIGPSGLLNV
ncbi:MAG TPA: thiol reductant ABC exporter subunit CydC [Solirubrobacteraceae bacterium]|nr:thiol reductant ABC exporter subunit CydC [Solirubrobacteraceae bacterium]HUA74069.1 thiol reductant ABC exporter subunit CydC [Solirubrobacteraceae bacterium]